MKSFVISFFFIICCWSAQSQETKVIVRAKAKDAKFIGSSIGGAYVAIKDAQNGRILAEGLTSGGTGNTNKIMKSAHERHVALSDANTAKFETSLSLEKPVL